MDKSYNKFERAYEIIDELTKSPLPFDPVELSNMSDKELKFLKLLLIEMANYLNDIGFEFKGLSEEVLTFISDEIENRAIESNVNILYFKHLRIN
ncbi:MULTISPECIES: hypothetical protein [Campylobacter]|uniref:hypothetical protein n=1 Tax=Campylobacter TaxID=194 RepID=UPI0023F02A1B|nr:MULTISPECIES: hypothetical protein [Campylobacter]MCI6641470.1 hypothetical protein [Campylobacter sp.]MDD7422150.1 hypothetical protein [Campylobacter hominis]MDY3117811.1 hypothetical protein [Campylobacter hominis]